MVKSNPAETIFKDRYHRVGIKLAHAIAKTLGYNSGEYDVRSNKAGSACTGEITLHTDNIYIQFQADACAVIAKNTNWPEVFNCSVSGNGWLYINGTTETRYL